ncbi:GPI mannosyltransferase 2 [Byssothecium circinans]|uniref:GPI mannosyltransferase 2 n=1 Tax=Byssothecium circinans TaxID=147558 RepID=A0A6A5TFK8_9PLEO|nr:GPI mannosyltransferase 2 [Byssothecium circinans]
MILVKKYRVLTAVFFAWKCILFAIAALAPGPGYDTSALILSNPSLRRHAEFKNQDFLGRIALKLFRWDALYFVTAAQRGQVYEQEWAFSWAYSGALRMITRFFFCTETPPLSAFVWTAVAISTLMHLSAVMILFRLLNVLTARRNGGRISFLACILHIMSPAGLFLVSPYAESAFASLNFLGMLCYAQAGLEQSSNRKQTFRQDALILCSGMCFALATVARSNGLLSGLIYLFDFAACVPSVLRSPLSGNGLRRITVICAAGVLVAVGFVAPQYVAYREYCTLGRQITTPWCQRRIPSIYAWVQSTYWNVGLFRYWTLPNLPLFLLAAPMLCLLLQSSIVHLRYSRPRSSGADDHDADVKDRDASQDRALPDHFPQLVFPQLVLAITAATSFHVQIINRISSGYPMWYLSIARWIPSRKVTSENGTSSKKVVIIVRGMIMYAIIQGALFANFLPPA